MWERGGIGPLWLWRDWSIMAVEGLVHYGVHLCITPRVLDVITFWVKKCWPDFCRNSELVSSGVMLG